MMRMISYKNDCNAFWHRLILKYCCQLIKTPQWLGQRIFGKKIQTDYRVTVVSMDLRRSFRFLTSQTCCVCCFSSLSSCDVGENPLFFEECEQKRECDIHQVESGKHLMDVNSFWNVRIHFSSFSTDRNSIIQRQAFFSVSRNLKDISTLGINTMLRILQIVPSLASCVLLRFVINTTTLEQQSLLIVHSNNLRKLCVSDDGWWRIFTAVLLCD